MSSILTLLTESTMTCPSCGLAKSETMPINACQIVYSCTRCNAVLQPGAGDCCVYCTYGSVPCPPIQIERSERTAPAPQSAPALK